jgi:hypothetical protein
VPACNWIKQKHQWFYDQFGYFWFNIICRLI